MASDKWTVTERIQGTRKVAHKTKCDSLETAFRLAADGAAHEMWVTVTGPGLRCPVVVRPASGYGSKRGKSKTYRSERGRFAVASNSK